MKAFITGVTGFVGSHLAEHLLASGDEVIGCSRNGVWPEGTPSDLQARVETFRWDLSDDQATDARRRLEDFRPDAIYHLAALSIPSACGLEVPAPTAIACNVEGTGAIVDAVLRLRLRCRMLMASSCYVYKTVDPSQPRVSELAAVGPNRGYGITKLAAEKLVQDAVRRDGLDAVVARAFQHSGPRQSPQMILPDWARQFASGGVGPVRVVCLDTFLDLTDVRDIVRAYRAMLLDGATGAVYNVGSGVSRRSGDLLDEMRRLCDPRRDVVELSPGRRQHPIADISKLQARTGWEPQIPIQKTIKDTLDFWLLRSRG